MASSDHWTINGGSALVEGDTGTIACLSPCPCVGYTLQSMGLNSTELGGKKVVLVTDFNLSNTGLPLSIAEIHTTFDDSTAAPLPAGPAPPLPPALTDPTIPVVAAVPPAVVYDHTTQLPPSIPITFTLAAAFPLKWVLTLISDPNGQPRDLTNGASGAAVAPHGGSWSDQTLTIVLTLTPPFLNTLPPGAHHFYMTAVNQRGTFNLGVTTLAVS
jgi:hypothetical protein